MDTYNYQAGMQPITAGISRIGQDVTSGVQNIEKDIDQKKIQQANDAQNQQAYGQVKDFFGRVRGVKLDGLEPKPNEPNPQYVERLKKAAPALVDQLKTAGVDPNELRKAVAIPGFALDDVQKLIYKRTGTQLEQKLNALPNTPGAVADTAAGVKSPEQINQERGTNVTPEDYEKAMGLQPINPAAGHTPGPHEGPTITPSTAAQQAPGYAQPISYKAASEAVRTADLPETEKEQFKQQLETIANREASRLIKPGETSGSQFAKSYMGEGLPETKEIKSAQGELPKDIDLLKEQYKKRYTDTFQMASNNKMLQALMQKQRFDAIMERAYGKDASQYTDKLEKAMSEFAKYKGQLDVAYGEQGQLDEKLPSDIPVLIDEVERRDGEIRAIEGRIRDAAKKSESYQNPSASAAVRLPHLAQPGEPIAPPQGDQSMRMKHRKSLEEYGTATP